VRDLIDVIEIFKVIGVIELIRIMKQIELKFCGLSRIKASTPAGQLCRFFPNHKYILQEIYLS
jgi:hypothetical protein